MILLVNRSGGHIFNSSSCTFKWVLEKAETPWTARTNKYMACWRTRRYFIGKSRQTRANQKFPCDTKGRQDAGWRVGDIYLEISLHLLRACLRLTRTTHVPLLRSTICFQRSQNGMRRRSWLRDGLDMLVQRIKILRITTFPYVHIFYLSLMGTSFCLLN